MSRFRFNPGECELWIVRIKPEINSIQIIQKCAECGRDTGFCYYSKTGAPRPDRIKQKCEPCLQKALDNAFQKDQSHVMRLSAN